jgi:hypothetical protein
LGLAIAVVVKLTKQPLMRLNAYGQQSKNGGTSHPTTTTATLTATVSYAKAVPAKRQDWRRNKMVNKLYNSGDRIVWENQMEMLDDIWEARKKAIRN